MDEGEEDTLLVTRATGWLTQEELPDGTTLVGSHNGFNRLNRLAMLWTM